VEIKKAVKRGLILIGTFFGTCKIKLLMHNPIHITAVVLKRFGSKALIIIINIQKQPSWFL